MKAYLDAHPNLLDKNSRVADIVHLYRTEYGMGTIHPAIVNIIESDRSFLVRGKFPIFPGGTSSLLHDATHILLGIGFKPNEEAFVVGYSYGSTKKWGYLRLSTYKLISKYFYPRKYRFNSKNIKFFNQGFQAGQKYAQLDISSLSYDQIKNLSIGSFRDICFNKPQDFLNYKDHLLYFHNS